MQSIRASTTTQEGGDAIKTLEARGARIPALGFGTWQLTGGTCAKRVREALEIGYRHLDTAQMYENEEEVGRGLREASVDREDVFVTTKLWLDNLSRDAVRESTEASLRRLGTEYLDLLLIHWPSEEVPLEETLEAMSALRDEGRIRHLGVSNFPPSWLARADEAAPVVCNQVEYHPLLSQERLLRSVRERGLALVAYSPLAHGLVAKEKTLSEIGREHGKSAAQVALRWLLQQDAVGAIPKAASRRHVEENLEIFDFELDAEEMRRVTALDRGERTIDPDIAPAWER